MIYYKKTVISSIAFPSKGLKIVGKRKPNTKFLVRHALDFIQNVAHASHLNNDVGFKIAMVKLTRDGTAKYTV